MPIYEFHCEKCERDSEILVRSSDWKGTACPHCGSRKLSKKFSTFASAGAGDRSMPSLGSGNGGGGCCGGALPRDIELFREGRHVAGPLLIQATATRRPSNKFPAR